MNRDLMMAAGLPVVDKCWKRAQRGIRIASSQRNDDAYFNICVIGPTAEEVEAHMPDLAAYVDEEGGWARLDEYSPEAEEYPGPLLLPVDEQTALADTLEAYWYWDWLCDGCAHDVVLALPPEIDPERQLQLPDAEELERIDRQLHQARREADPGLAFTSSRHWNSLYEYTNKPGWRAPIDRLSPRASAGLLISSMLATGGMQWLVLDDAELSDNPSRRLRQYLAEQCWYVTEHVGEAYAQMRAGVADAGWTIVSNSDTWDEERLSRWLANNRGFRPEAAWAIDATGKNSDDESSKWVSVVVPGFGTIGSSSTRLVHLRRLPGQWSKRARTDAEFVERLIEVAAGETDREEDDRFTVLDFILKEDGPCNWSACQDEKAAQPMDSFIDSRGYPLKTTEEVCSRIERVERWEPDQPMNGCVLLPLRERHAGMPLFKSSTVKETLVDVLVLHCDDAEFLGRVLNDDLCYYVYFVSQSMGSLQEPVILPHVVKQARVPWPSAPQRREILDRTHRTIKLDIGEAQGFGEQVSELRTKLHELASVAEDELDPAGVAEDVAYLSALPTSPFYYERIWDELRGLYQQIGHELSRYSGLDMAQPQHRQIPPALIAIMMRQIGAEASSQARFDRYFGLADTIIRYDVSILLSVLARYDARAVARIFAHLGNVSDKGWKASMGSWADLQQHAYKHLARAASDSAEANEALERYRQHLCNVKRKEAGTLTEKIISLRNNTKGHGFTLPQAVVDERGLELAGDVEQLKLRVAHLFEFPLLYVRGRQVQRTGCCLDVLMLTHDNPVFESSGRHASSEHLEGVHDGEVHLNYASEPYLLSLYPWLHLAPARESGQEAIWLLDGFDEQAAQYKSPMAPGEILSLTEPRAEVQRLTGL